MSLKSATLVAGILSAAGFLLGALSMAQSIRQYNSSLPALQLTSWAVGILAEGAVALFLLVLYAKQNAAP